MAGNFEVKDLQGALFVNNDKQNEKHPDYRGQCKIDGVEYWVSGWKKKSQSGASYMSLAFQPKDEAGGGNRGGGNRGGQRGGYGGGNRGGNYNRGGSRGGSSRQQQPQRGEAYEGDDGDDDFR